jgi:hypothetical protein
MGDRVDTHNTTGQALQQARLVDDGTGVFENDHFA